MTIVYVDYCASSPKSWDIYRIKREGKSIYEVIKEAKKYLSKDVYLIRVFENVFSKEDMNNTNLVWQEFNF